MATTDYVHSKASSEPMTAHAFSLTAVSEEYRIHRSWSHPYKGMQYPVDRTFPLPRNILPPECNGIARFFVNKPQLELDIGMWTWAEPLVKDHLPTIDEQYPPCSVLLGFGTFADTAPQGGVVATGPSGVLAIDTLVPSNPALYGLMPATVVADIWLNVAVIFAAPFIVVPGVVVMYGQSENELAAPKKPEAALPVAVVDCWSTAEKNTNDGTLPAPADPSDLFRDPSEPDTSRKLEAGLPVAVVNCWSAANKCLEDGGLPAPADRFDRFRWDPADDSAFSLGSMQETDDEKNSAAGEARITLEKASVRMRHNSDWTDAQFVCDLSGGNIVAAKLSLVK